MTALLCWDGPLTDRTLTEARLRLEVRLSIENSRAYRFCFTLPGKRNSWRLARLVEWLERRQVEEVCR